MHLSTSLVLMAIIITGAFHTVTVSAAPYNSGELCKTTSSAHSGNFSGLPHISHRQIHFTKRVTQAEEMHLAPLSSEQWITLLKEVWLMKEEPIGPSQDLQQQKAMWQKAQEIQTDFLTEPALKRFVYHPNNMPEDLLLKLYQYWQTIKQDKKESPDHPKDIPEELWLWKNFYQHWRTTKED
ncbi:hypothetical protein BC835DRAFT_1454772 [Cytidiella melzeri]|nr:hypothetical protein BC835DRAFT_1454772 [Cytidiella melzeri]